MIVFFYFLLWLLFFIYKNVGLQGNGQKMTDTLTIYAEQLALFLLLLEVQNRARRLVDICSIQNDKSKVRQFFDH
jgi:hypothetical protein